MLNLFYWEPRHLNIKKVIIISIILIIILISIILLIAKKISTPKDIPSVEPVKTSTVYYSNDNSISIELSNNLNLKKYNSDYLLELRSSDNLDIFISKESIIQNKELLDIVNADKSSFLSNFQGYSNLSDIKELLVNNNLAYTYSFHYLDTNLNKAFYIQIIWLQIDEQYYIFDIEFPLDNLSFYTNISTSVLSTFKVYK